MKKILVLIIGCMILGACVTLTPEQKRELFEQKVSKPELKCELPNVENPSIAKVSVSMDEVPVYACSYGYWKVLFPVQKINNRELLAYPCINCYDMKLYHVKFPYTLGDLRINTLYQLPGDICIDEDPKLYHYTTATGLKNTIHSVTFVRKRKYSQQERQQIFKKIKVEKQKSAQRDAQEKYEEAKRAYEKCQKTAEYLVKLWQSANNIQDYCQDIDRLLPKHSGSSLGSIPDWGPYQNAHRSVKEYYMNTCFSK